jgi:hypothetical protein
LGTSPNLTPQIQQAEAFDWVVNLTFLLAEARASAATTKSKKSNLHSRPMPFIFCCVLAFNIYNILFY